jgi:hypothetical protein
MGRAWWRDRGGILGLYGLLREHGEAIEADLQRYYTLPLSALGTRALTWRRLGVLLRQLPAESALHRGVAGPSWDVDTQLLAVTANRLGILAWQGAGSKGKPPEPIKPPETKRPRSLVSVPEMRRRLAADKARRARQLRQEVSDVGS